MMTRHLKLVRSQRGHLRRIWRVHGGSEIGLYIPDRACRRCSSDGMRASSRRTGESEGLSVHLMLVCKSSDSLNAKLTA